MNRKNEQEERLTTWGEIADYLGISVRTAQQWEKERNLPVRRIPGHHRSTVVAFRSELDAWLEGKLFSGKTGRPFYRYGLFLSVLVILVGGFLLLHFWWRVDRNPVSFHADGNRLQALNQNGTLLWEWSDPEFVAANFETIFPPFATFDLNRDGINEAAYIFKAINVQLHSGMLVCFSSSGEDLWKLEFNKPLRFAGKELLDRFAGWVVFPVEVAGELRLVAGARHRGRFPSLVWLIDPHDGSVEDEYIHPGYVRTYLVRDVDGDQTDELLLGGVNNPGQGIGHAFLAVLDLPFSTSTQTGFFGDTGPREIAYFLFPRTRLGSLRMRLAKLKSIWLENNRLLIEVLTGFGALFYELDLDFQLVGFRLSDEFRAQTQEARLRGLDQIDLPPYERLSKILRVERTPDGNSPLIEELFENAPECTDEWVLPCILKLDEGRPGSKTGTD